jgi:hypothetical protein
VLLAVALSVSLAFTPATTVGSDGPPKVRNSPLRRAEVGARPGDNVAKLILRVNGTIDATYRSDWPEQQGNDPFTGPCTISSHQFDHYNYDLALRRNPRLYGRRQVLVTIIERPGGEPARPFPFTPGIFDALNLTQEGYNQDKGTCAPEFDPYSCDEAGPWRLNDVKFKSTSPSELTFWQSYPDASDPPPECGTSGQPHDRPWLARSKDTLRTSDFFHKSSEVLLRGERSLHNDEMDHYNARIRGVQQWDMTVRWKARFTRLAMCKHCSAAEIERVFQSGPG